MNSETIPLYLFGILAPVVLVGACIFGVISHLRQKKEAAQRKADLEKYLAEEKEENTKHRLEYTTAMKDLLNEIREIHKTIQSK